MIKKLTLLMMLLPIFGFGQTTDLLFSKYGEGQANNKFYEIYNGTGAAVDLTQYSVKLYTNGSSSAQSTLAMRGILANNASYVVVHPLANNPLPGYSDTISNTCGFNGDDVLELSKNGVVIDVFGEVGVDPGTSWNIAGNPNAGVDKVLTRKPTVCSPTNDWALSFGVDSLTSQWLINPLLFNSANLPTLASGLGLHVANCANPCATPPVVLAGANQSVCAGSDVTLSASGALTYVWNNGVVDNQEFTPTVTNSYIVEGTDLNGCTGTDTVVVTVNALPVVTISENANVLTASLSGVDYEWMNCVDSAVVATTQVFTPTANGSYFVEVTDANGCVGSSACMAVTTLGLESKTAMNTFNISPNPTKGKVTITATDNESASVVIFNALGKQISKVNNIQNGSVIDFSAFNNGVYMVQITSNKGTKVQRVVKN